VVHREGPPSRNRLPCTLGTRLDTVRWALFQSCLADEDELPLPGTQREPCAAEERRDARAPRRKRSDEALHAASLTQTCRASVYCTRVAPPHCQPRTELAPIRVNRIAAGLVDTPLSLAMTPTGGAMSFARRCLIRRGVEPADVAALAIFRAVSDLLGCCASPRTHARMCARPGCLGL
jgi:hypothetical protein